MGAIQALVKNIRLGLSGFQGTPPIFFLGLHYKICTLRELLYCNLVHLSLTATSDII
jgi:hypothetical protein